MSQRAPAANASQRRASLAFAAQAKGLLDGMMYSNVHTEAHKAGKIGEQMEKAM
jgi:hypothetical protein